MIRGGTDDDFTNRIMLFEARANFRNYTDSFRYQPSVDVRHITLYSKSKYSTTEDLKIEFDYTITTNNAGLVMNRNLRRDSSALYVIGDSFTEGQGAEPWFYEIEKKERFRDPQLVNLGILGTGPQQWLSLTESVKQEYNHDVNGIVLNLLPGDMERNPWTFRERELRCLRLVQCDYRFGFQGFRFDSSMNHEDIKKEVLARLKLPVHDFVVSIKELLKRSRVISDIYVYFKRENHDQTQKRNEFALTELNTIAKGNLFINLVSHRINATNSVNSLNYNNYEPAVRLIKFLQKNDINYKWCDIPETGFHIIDGHPNKNGYRVLSGCTEVALQQLGY